MLATGNAAKLGLRDGKFLEESDIEYHLGKQVSSINREEKKVVLSDGSSVSYDKLLLATGGRARVTKNEGSDLKGIHYLRTG